MSFGDGTRADHLRLVKLRAIDYLDRGLPVLDAYYSVTSDLQKHPETAGLQQCAGMFVMVLAAGPSGPTEAEMREWIAGLT